MQPYLNAREIAEIESLTNDLVWVPSLANQPQQDAYRIAQHGEVMQLGYGGQAGGGKTDLALGLAATIFQKTLYFRREFTQLTDVIERGNEIFPNKFVGSPKNYWRLGKRLIRCRGADQPEDWKKYQGQSNDLIVFDEAAEFTENIVRSISGWARTTDIDQHTMVLLCFNPPTTPEGEWIIQMFAPWIDPDYPGERAVPGEVRYFWRDADDKEHECGSGEPFYQDGRTVYPISRTFIPASRHDNPYLGEQYERQLDNLPEPLRTMLRDGDFTVTAKADAWQTIPTAWILQAQERWRKHHKPDINLRCIGVDVARGGDDNTVISKLYGNWFDRLIVYPGSQTPDGPTGADKVLDAMETPCDVGVDVIGIGASVYDQLKMVAPGEIIAVNNSEAAPSGATDIAGQYEFTNVRAASYWALREALNPSSGENLMLPDDRQLRVDLAAPKYKVVGRKYQIEKKDDIKKRLGRSPDKGDAVVICWWVVKKPRFKMWID